MTDNSQARTAEQGKNEIIYDLRQRHGLTAESTAPWKLVARAKAEQLVSERDPRPEWATRGYEAQEFREFDREYVFYALFHNPENDQYLVTACDARGTLFGDSRQDAIVDALTFDGAGRTQDEILAEARTLWNEHIDSLIAFHPIAERRNVDALHEACRVKAAADPALPEKKLFDFYNAYHLAYGGPDGARRALRDVYGPEGCRRQLSDRDIHACINTPYRNDTERIGPRYDVTASQFIGLYEKMDDRDRQDFRAALTAFITEDLRTAADVIGDEEKTARYAGNISGPLAHLQAAVKFGSGVAEAYNYGALGFWTEEAIESVVTQNRHGLLRKKDFEDVIARLKDGGYYDAVDNTPEWPTGDDYKAPAHWSAKPQPARHP